jgi:hypothetical protein
MGVLSDEEVLVLLPRRLLRFVLVNSLIPLVKTTPHATGGKQKEKGKLQITEELNNGLRKTKVGCCNKYLVLDTVRTPLGGEEFYEIKKILIGNFN